MTESDGAGVSIDEWTNDVHCGDVHDTLDDLPENSIHCVITSPPYYGLRDYEVDGQIGLEESLADYIDELVDVGSRIRRVLRDDGSWWLNLGDSYARSGTAGGRHHQDDFLGGAPAEADASNRHVPDDLPEKCKMLVPHRTAIALVDDGWILRNDVVWSKPNPMPEAVKDRLSTTHESVFHLTLDQQYWYDLDSIRKPVKSESIERMNYASNKADPPRPRRAPGTWESDQFCHPGGKNPGDVFDIPTQSFPEAHFAVFPEALVETPLKATCPPKVCSACGAGYERVVEVERKPGSTPHRNDANSKRYEGVGDRNDANELRTWPDRDFKGWEPGCECDTDATEAGVVLDPFAGAGTTCLVAKRLGRRFVGIDLNPEFVALAQGRVGIDVDDPELLLDEGETELSEFVDVDTDGSGSGVSESDD